LLITVSSRTAICRGAVTKGFIDGLSAGGTSRPNSLAVNIDAPIKVTSTVSRFSLGMIYKCPFDEDEHLQEDKEWDSDEEEWKAAKQMKWFLKKVCDIPACCK
jgi:hypothetical protein